jgi:hypothetical protein
MKRLVLSMASVCVVSLLSGCCWPGMWLGSPFGGCSSGCQSGGCAPGMGPTGYNSGVGAIQTGYPGAIQGPVAYSPYGPAQVAYPQQLQPTIAMDSLPTYR